MADGMSQGSLSGPCFMGRPQLTVVGFRVNGSAFGLTQVNEESPFIPFSSGNTSCFAGKGIGTRERHPKD